MDSLVNFASWYCRVGTTFLLVNIVLGLIQSATFTESIRAEASRCGLSSDKALAYPAWLLCIYIFAAWPVGIIRLFIN
jgi:hypothetical protein